MFFILLCNSLCLRASVELLSIFVCSCSVPPQVSLSLLVFVCACVVAELLQLGTHRRALQKREEMKTLWAKSRAKQ